MNKDRQTLALRYPRLLLLGFLTFMSGCVAKQSASAPEHSTNNQHVVAPAPTSQPAGQVIYQAIYLDQPPIIDGDLSDPSWSAATWTDPFVDIEGDKRPRPHLITRAKMAWDDDYFYIAAWLEEPHVWGTLTARDSIIYNDNDFEVFIDPESDAKEYFEYEVNALNTPFDLTLSRPYVEGGTFDISWDIIGLKTAVGIDGSLNDPSDIDQAWTVELAIPWASLTGGQRAPGPPVSEERWRVNFSRVQWQHQIVDGKYQRRPETREDNWVWVPTGVIDMHRPRRWGFVEFVR